MTESNECIFGSLLSAFHDGELSDERREDVKQHIRTCGVCAAELADIRRFASVFRAAPAVDFPADVEQRLNAAFDQALAEEQAEVESSPMRITPETVTRKEPQHLSYVRWISGLAAAVFVLAIGRVGYLHYNEQNNPAGPKPGDTTVFPMPGSQPSESPDVGPTVPPAKLPGQS